MYFGESYEFIINKQELLEDVESMKECTIYENFYENSDESLNEASLFISKQAKELKKQIKEITKEEYKDDRKFFDRLKGSFNGANSAKWKSDTINCLSKIKKLLKVNKIYGPCSRERSYTVGNTTYYETYYIYHFYSKLNNKMIHIEFEGPLFSFQEYDCKIPDEMLNYIYSIAPESGDLRITKNKCSLIQKNAIISDKSFAKNVFEKAESLNIKVSYGLLKNSVKF